MILVMLYVLIAQNEQTLNIDNSVLEAIQQMPRKATLAEQHDYVNEIYLTLKNSDGLTLEAIKQFHDSGAGSASDALVTLFTYQKVSEDYLKMLPEAFKKGAIDENQLVVEYVGTLKNQGAAFAMARMSKKAIEAYERAHKVAIGTYMEIPICHQLVQLTALLKQYDQTKAYIKSAIKNPAFLKAEDASSLSSHLYILRQRFALAYLAGEGKYSADFFEQYFAVLNAIKYVDPGIDKHFQQYRYLFNKKILSNRTGEISKLEFDRYMKESKTDIISGYKVYSHNRKFDIANIRSVGHSTIKERILRTE